MHIIHIASELAPLAKVGGLADVLLGLSRELSWKGHDVDIIIPKYDCMDSNEVRDLSVAYQDLISFYEEKWYNNTIWTGWVENLRVYFIDPHHPNYFFNRGCFYGCEDDTDRYLYFSRVALEFLFKKQIKPDIIHLHDWHTAVVAPLYKDMYYKLGLSSAKIVLTIHNLEYQGRCGFNEIDKIGLNHLEYASAEKLLDPVYPDTINLLKGGIVYADYVNTVSPSYAEEVMTPERGNGLDGVLRQYKHKFSGILNGIDYSYWNPEIDRYLPVHFSSREYPASKKDRVTLDKKAYLKKVIRERLLLSEDHRPIVGCVTRLVPQKGLELIKAAIEYTLAHSGQFILVGSTPIPAISADFYAIKHQHLDDPYAHFTLHYQEELSHLVFAAADMFVMPSLFEPCGLTQMIALKYGAVPIVRRTGGLLDTIFDVDNSGLPFDQTNGYNFEEPNKESLEAALARAFDLWFHHPDKWRKLMVNGMNTDYSWNRSSNVYLKIYQSLHAAGK